MVFKIYEVKVIRTIQGQPRSKIMVPIDSTWVVYYLTFIDCIIVSVTVFEISHDKFSLPWTMRSSRVILCLISYLTYFEYNIITVIIFEIFDVKTLCGKFGVKIGGKLWPVQSSTHLCDRLLINWLIHRQTNFIIRPMLLMHLTNKMIPKVIYLNTHMHFGRWRKSIVSQLLHNTKLSWNYQQQQQKYQQDCQF